MQGHVAKAFGVPVSAGRCEGSKLNAEIAGRSPGGRPLRRRREMMLICDRQRLRGTAALHVAIAHRCHDRMGQKLEQARTPGQPQLEGTQTPFRFETVSVQYGVTRGFSGSVSAASR